MQKRPSWALGCEARRWENHKIYQTSKFTHHLNCNETNQHSRPEAGYSLVMMMTKTSFIRATNWRRLDFPTLDFPWAPTIPNQREDGHYWRWGRKNKKMMMMMIVHDLIMQFFEVFRSSRRLSWWWGGVWKSLWSYILFPTNRKEGHYWGRWWFLYFCNLLSASLCYYHWLPQILYFYAKLLSDLSDQHT